MPDSGGIECPDIIILNGQTASGAVLAHEVYDDALSITLFGDPSLEAVIFRIQTTPDRNPTASSTWYDFYVGNPPVAVVAPTASVAQTYYDLTGQPAFRIVAASAVGGNRTIKMRKKSRES